MIMLWPLLFFMALYAWYRLATPPLDMTPYRVYVEHMREAMDWQRQQFEKQRSSRNVKITGK